MAPEQLEGKDTDPRTDIFTFGAVVYEMVTGKRAFEGGNQASLISSILKDEPPAISTLQPLIPQSLDHVVNRCLAKDPDDRWQTARDVVMELKWADESGSQAGIQATERSRNRERLAWAVAALAVLAALALAVVLRDTTQGVPVRKLSVSLPEDTWLGSFAHLAVSPDGKRLAYIAGAASGQGDLWVRPLDSLTSDKIPGTEGARFPFWSPDSREIGFFAERKLKKVGLFGAPPETLCDVEGLGRGGTWNREGVILFAGRGGLSRILESGGTVTQVTTPDVSRREGTHRWPSFLPDDRHFFYTGRSSIGEHTISVGSIDSNQTTHLVNAFSSPVYATPGYLLYVRDGMLLAHRFDLAQYQLVGDPVPLAEEVRQIKGIGLGLFSVSETGVLSYVTGIANRQPTWFDRTGRRLQSFGNPELDCYHASLSPDNRRVVLSCMDAELRTPDIWVLDLSQNMSARLTLNPRYDHFPIWSPTSDRLVYRSDKEEGNVLCEQPSSGDGEEIELLRVGLIRPTHWSPDGQYILYQSDETSANSDLWLLPMFGSRQPQPFLQTPFSEVEGRISPDGVWVAYSSNETGRFEVYIQPFPAGGPKQQISMGGGRTPRWRQDGAELFYIADDGNLTVVSVSKSDAELEVGDPRALFRRDWSEYAFSYGVASDGQRFLFSAGMAGRSRSMAVVLNWTAELEP
jgi:Tol biopolymer transport system component